MSLSLITINVGALSIERSHRQLQWLAGRPEDVFVLTETKATTGSVFLAEAFTAAGYAVTFPEHLPGELGVMIVSKVAATADPLGTAMDYLPARGRCRGRHYRWTAACPGRLRTLRDAALDKTERKKT